MYMSRASVVEIDYTLWQHILIAHFELILIINFNVMIFLLFKNMFDLKKNQKKNERKYQWKKV